ncbi:MAG: rhodanese-like domain-containing protein [Pseudomonadota bacterium]
MEKDISADALKRLLAADERTLLVDVRDPDEVAADKFEGAVNWPLDAVSQHLDGADPDRPIVFVCKTGKRSRQACAFARMAGFGAAASLEGGLDQWTR